MLALCRVGGSRGHPLPENSCGGSLNVWGRSWGGGGHWIL